MEPKYNMQARSGIRRPPLFKASGRPVVQLSHDDAPILQRLLERCGDYYDMVEGRAAEPDAAIGELTEGPPERVPHDLFCLGIVGDADALVGTIGALRHHRRTDQWYLGLMLLDPSHRNQSFGRAAYQAFEKWIIGEGASSVVLAVVEANCSRGPFLAVIGLWLAALLSRAHDRPSPPRADRVRKKLERTPAAKLDCVLRFIRPPGFFPPPGSHHRCRARS
jgi:GNAT superfamily N-acetyltransferase